MLRRGLRFQPFAPPIALVVALALALSSPGTAPATPAAPSAASGAGGMAGSGTPGSGTAPFGGASAAASDESARALAAETARLDAEARAPATDIRIAPSASRGVIGAWLVAGPFKAGRPALDALPVGVTGIDEAALAASSGGALGGERDFGAQRKKPPAHWMITSSSDGAVDLKSALELPSSDLIAYASGVLHVEHAGRHLLALGVDDGVRVLVDGATVLSRDDGRPVREDDDVVPLDLTAGDHTIVLKLHQRDGAWAFRARIVDATLAPPAGAYLRLPGTNADDARTLVTRMSSVSLDRAFDGTVDPPRYRPKLTVRYPEGAPRGVPASRDRKPSRVAHHIRSSSDLLRISAAVRRGSRDRTSSD